MWLKIYVISNQGNRDSFHNKPLLFEGQPLRKLQTAILNQSVRKWGQVNITKAIMEGWLEKLDNKPFRPSHAVQSTLIWTKEPIKQRIPVQNL